MRSSPTFATLIMATSVLAWPAAAEITPEEVWTDWLRVIENSEVEIEIGTEDVSDGTLTLSDVVLSADFPEDSGSFATSIPEIKLEDRGDGTVQVMLSPEYPVALSGTDADTGEEFAINMIVRQAGLVTIASRDDDTTRYDYVGPEVGVGIASLSVDGQPVDFDFDIAFSGIKGSYELVEDTPRRFSGSFSAEALEASGAGSDPEDASATFSIDANLSDFSQSGSGTIVGLMGFTNMSAMMAEGFETDWKFTHGEAEYTISGSDDESKFRLRSSASSGVFEGVISPDGLSYGGGNTDVSVSVSSSDIPFPQLTFNMTESQANLTIPVTPQEDAGDMALLLRLVDLKVSEAIWGMFDPADQLPRDPATLVLDLSGKARWLVDIFDPEVSTNMSPGEVPGEVEALTLNELKLSVAGAELTGNGAFEFNNAPDAPFAPAPSPVGAINLQLSGGNALLDTLVNMGLIPQEQAMGARMMLGLFARPGNGPDSLTSTIEVGADGSVSANGQRIR